MRKIIFISTFLCSIHISNAQSVEAHFLIRVMPDTGWTLHLNKDKTYSYSMWSMLGGKPKVLESGNYTLNNEIITLTCHNPYEGISFCNKVYIIKKVKPKQMEDIEYLYVSEKKVFLGRRFYVLIEK